MPNKIFDQLYFVDTVQAEQSGLSAVINPAADTLTKNLYLESDDGMLLKYEANIA